ncbi:hypothetical protein B0H11DRAFT_2013359 [Mycena galericulata]|nr:hypothetical protein B0H11DRAFT_2013359 [Mycena galericulata]
MPSPPIEVFLTTIASQPALRQRQEYILRILQVKKISFTSYDLASDEKAKRLWKRKAPLDKQQLPGILVGGRFPGPFSEFEDAVECDDLDVFLRLKESWDADIDADTSALPAMPIGVPGAMLPLQMTPEHLRTKIIAGHQHPSPLKGKEPTPVNKRTDMFDVSTELSGFGLQGVQVTEDELRDLVAELGLDGDEAGDLVKGLSSASPAKVSEPKPVPVEAEPEPVPAKIEPEPVPAKVEPEPVPALAERETAPTEAEPAPELEVKPTKDAPKPIESSEPAPMDAEPESKPEPVLHVAKTEPEVAASAETESTPTPPSTD